MSGPTLSAEKTTVSLKYYKYNCVKSPLSYTRKPLNYY